MSKNVPPEAIIATTTANAVATDGSTLKMTINVVEHRTLPQSRTSTKDELDEAWKMVCDKEHRKNPINAIINADQKKLVDAAIAHHAFGFAKFEDLPDGRVRVTAPGYWGAEGLMGAI